MRAKPEIDLPLPTGLRSSRCAVEPTDRNVYGTIASKDGTDCFHLALRRGIANPGVLR